MKNKNLFTFILLIPLLSSCGGSEATNKKVALFSGKEYEEVGDVFKQSEDSTYQNFKYATQNKESFIGIIYNSFTCSCYFDFRLAAQDYFFKNNIDPFTIDAKYLENEKDLFNIKLPNSLEYPVICLFKEGKLAKQINYDKTNSVFTKEDAIKALVDENYYHPVMIHTTIDNLDEKIASNEEFFVYFRQETCSDCAQFSQNILSNYFTNGFENNLFKAKLPTIYMLDEDYDFEGYVWQEIKDLYGLSNAINTELGYNTGYVPTVQYYKNSSLSAMMVYLNDKIVENKVERTYYTAENINKQDYLKGKEPFLNREIKNRDDIINYHNDIALSFLDYYFK